MDVPIFSAKDNEGRVQAQLQNTGSISSAYFVSVVEWSEGLEKPGVAQSLSLAAGEAKNVTIRLYTVGENALSNQFITMQVYHATTAEIFDVKTLEFNVSKTIIECWPQCGDLSEAGQSNRLSKQIFFWILTLKISKIFKLCVGSVQFQFCQKNVN